jgi:hypothetical protein
MPDFGPPPAGNEAQNGVQFPWADPAFRGPRPHAQHTGNPHIHPQAAAYPFDAQPHSHPAAGPAGAGGMPPGPPPPPPPPPPSGNPQRPLRPQHTNAFVDFLRGPMLEGRAENIRAIPFSARGARGPSSWLRLLSVPLLYPRRTRQIISAIVWLGPVSAGLYLYNLTHKAEFMDLVGWWLGGGWILARWPPFIALFIRRVCCPLCREHLDLYSRWFCGCGYNDHRLRNFYTLHCPLCRGWLGWFNCPRCQSTIIM